MNIQIVKEGIRNAAVPGDFPDLSGVHIWLADLDRMTADPQDISMEERQKAAQFSHDLMRQRYLASRAFCRRVLSPYAGIAPGELELIRPASGKPYLPGDGQPQFNLSHSGSLALLAISRNRAVGIDLEPVIPRPNMLAIARRVLDAAVVEELAAIPDTERQLEYFTQAWTAFEARQKLTGNGIFGAKAAPAHRIIPFSPQPGWSAALAVEGETDPSLTFFDY